MLRLQPHAARRRIARAPPPMNKDGRASAPLRLRPVPVRHDDKIIKGIRAPEPLMRGRKWRTDHEVIVLMLRVIAPKIPGPDRHRPIGRPRHPVRAIQHPHQPMHTHRCPAIPLAFVGHDASPPHDTREPPSKKPNAHGSHNKVSSFWQKYPGVWGGAPADRRRRRRNTHIKCPDFRAFTSR